MYKDIIAIGNSCCSDTCMFNGTPMNFEGKDQFISMQGDTVNVTVARLPAWLP